MTTTKILSKNELIDTIQSIKGVTFVSLVYEGDARLKKTGNPNPTATKVCSLSGVIGNVSYTNSVENQMEREGVNGEFHPEKRAWGERQGNLVFHKDNYYIEMKVQAASEPVYYSTDGRRLDYDTEVKPYVAEKKEGERQPNETKVIWRDIKIDNVKSITTNGNVFVVKQ